jgi:hypothetical protein
LQEEQEEHAQQLAALLEDMELPMKISAGGELDGFVVQLQGVAFGYPGAPQLFENCEFGITSKSRIVLLGENGNGVSYRNVVALGVTSILFQWILTIVAMVLLPVENNACQTDHGHVRANQGRSQTQPPCSLRFGKPASRRSDRSYPYSIAVSTRKIPWRWFLRAYAEASGTFV